MKAQARNRDASRFDVPLVIVRNPHATRACVVDTVLSPSYGKPQPVTHEPPHWTNQSLVKTR